MVASLLVGPILAGCGSPAGTAGDGHDHGDRLRTPPHLPEVPPLQGARIAATGTRLVSCSQDAQRPQARALIRNVTDATTDFTATVSWTSDSGAVATRAVAVLRDLPAGRRREVTLIAAPNGAVTRCSLQVEYGRLAGPAAMHTPLSSPSVRDRLLRSPIQATPVHGGVPPVLGEHARLDLNFGRPDGASGRHMGVDVFAPAGSRVAAVVNGTLYSVGVSGMAGHRVWLRDGKGVDHLYAHLGGFADGVADGTVVRAGQVIGWVGTPAGPSSRGAFVHFEVHKDGRPIDPSALIRRWSGTG